MKEPPRSVQAYGIQRAQRYDRDSELVRGDRQRHRTYLRDLLRCLPDEPLSFVELGCGTGFFTEVFFEVFPRIRGIAIDGSEAMIQQAKARFREGRHDLTFHCEVLQELNWESLERTSLLFSGLVIHHLSDDEKRTLLKRLLEHLEPGGTFILLDSFRPEDPTADRILELLSCMQISRHVDAERGSVPPLDRVVARDREVKEAEGDQEASIDAHIHWLRDTGFQSVVSVFQDVRIACIVAFKPR